MDIHSSLPYPSCALSNFAAREFVVDGEPCASMEGLIQSLKFDDIGEQRQARALSGMRAKRFGAKRSGQWMAKQELWWLGQRMERASPELAALLDRAYQAMFDQCPDFQEALRASGSEELTHTVGSADPTKTALTEEELCSRLNRLRGARPGPKP